MKEGEKISSSIYIRHQKKLQDLYQQQQDLTDISGFINPAIAIKNFSMMVTGTDFSLIPNFKNRLKNTVIKWLNI